MGSAPTTPVRRAREGESRVRVPPTWVLMVAALAGLAVGPVVIALGAAGETADLARRSGPFSLWVSLIAAQTMVWTLALPPLALAARRHWSSSPRPDAAARRDVVFAAAALVLFVAAVPAVTSVLETTPPEFIPHGTSRVRFLTAMALLVALVAAASIWLIRGRLERLREGGATKENVRTYVGLRAQLERLLAYLGAVVGLAVLSSAAMRRVVEDAVARGIVRDDGVFPAEAVILYGFVLSLILALVYLPTYLVAQEVGAELRDELVPFPEPRRLGEGLEERRKLDEALGLSVSATASFRAGVAILAPLLGSLTTLLPTLE
jgi:hypothetical protein